MRLIYINSGFLFRTAIVGLLSLCFLPAFGQSPRTLNGNHSFWTELNISGKIKGKFSYQFDYQFRTQGESDKLRDKIKRLTLPQNNKYGTSVGFCDSLECKTGDLYDHGKFWYTLVQFTVWRGILYRL